MTNNTAVLEFNKNWDESTAVPNLVQNRDKVFISNKI